MHGCSFILATATTNVLLGAGGLIVVTIVGGVIILRVRRAMLSNATNDTQGLLLSDLRTMRDRGEISEEEFERLRAATLRGFGFDAGKSDAPRTDAADRLSGSGDVPEADAKDA